MKPQVLLEIKDKVAYLSLNRREANNSLTPRFLREVTDCVNQIAQHEAVKVVLLSANSTFFSIGGDMNYFKSHQHDLKPAAEVIVGCLNEMMMAMIALPVPIICAAHSVVTGGSLGFITASDLVVGSTDTVFKAHYSSAGFSPDGGWATMMPLIANQRKTAEFLMLNATCTAAEAERIGLINKVVDKDQVFATAKKWAARIANSPSGTIQNVKKILWGDLEQVRARLDIEYQHFVQLAQTEEAKQGIDAFLAQFSSYHSVEASQI